MNVKVMTEQIKAVVFDPLGALFYSSNAAESFGVYCKTRGINLDPATKKQFYSASREPDTLKKFTSKLPPKTEQAISTYISVVEEEVRTAELFPETVGVLERLRTEGKKIGILVDSIPLHKRVIRRLGLSPLIDAALYTCDTNYQKPQEQLFRIICGLLKTRPKECFYCGNDLERGVWSAQRSGLDGILIDRSGAYSNMNVKHIKSLDRIFPYLE